ncbi:Phosphoacetylglucosamine mutase [Cryptosporidium felis]|nr:Phosphoacetylglucosamine mutase [Cryptosporidium felis]
MSKFEENVRDILREDGSELSNLGPLIYGTAGFRMNYDENPHRVQQVAIFCTLIACLRSISEGKWVGVMVTASHNPITDNGIKIVDVTGSMLNREFEQICFDVINSGDEGSHLEVLKHKFREKLKVSEFELAELDFSKARLFLGHDTRPSSERILESIQRVISRFGISRYLNFGFTTTPQLHFMVAFANGLVDSRLPKQIAEEMMLTELAKDLENLREPKNRDIAGYLFRVYYRYHEHFFSETNKLIEADKTLMGPERSRGLLFQSVSSRSKEFKINETGSLLVDVANGVGRYHFEEISRIFAQANLSLKMINGDRPEKLNDNCGAEHIQKGVTPPADFYLDPRYDPDTVDYVAAFDGDADRLIYFAPNLMQGSSSKEDIFLIDGDRISACFTLIIVALLGRIVEEAGPKSGKPPVLSFGVVQTAYANGASTKYLQSLLKSLNPEFFEYRVCCVPTGVKHLHRRASEFDIAVYFEANGHGTVIHKPEKLRRWSEELSICKNPNSFQILTHFLCIFNPVIGDAISDMLAFEACRKYIQAHFGCRFSMDLYDDLFVVQDKVFLKRSDLDTLVCDEQTERFLVEPKKLQVELDNYLSNLKDNLSRAFIRPSGTEDVARIYVEAPTRESAKRTMDFVKDLLLRYFE